MPCLGLFTNIGLLLLQRLNISFVNQKDSKGDRGHTQKLASRWAAVIPPCSDAVAWKWIETDWATTKEFRPHSSLAFQEA